MHDQGEVLVKCWPSKGPKKTWPMDNDVQNQGKLRELWVQRIKNMIDSKHISQECKAWTGGDWVNLGWALKNFLVWA